MDLTRHLFLADSVTAQQPGMTEIVVLVLIAAVIIIAFLLYRTSRMKRKTERAAAKILHMSEEVLSLSSLPISRNEIGGYKLQEKLYESVGSISYRAVDRDGFPCDVKIPTTGSLQDKGTMARLEREAQVLEGIDNPHVVRFRAFERVKDRGRLIPLMVTEPLEGEDLSEIIKRDAPLPIGDVLQVLDHISAALAAVHRNEVVHRNVKPSSIKIEEDGNAVLYNFGVAQVEDMQALTQRGDVLGTGLYMSPEQITGKTVDPRSDIYALGIVAYEMLTGKPPHAGSAFGELVIKKMTQDPPYPSSERADIPPQLDDLVWRMLSKEPEKRPLSAGYLITELHNITLELESAASGQGVEYEE